MIGLGSLMWLLLGSRSDYHAYTLEVFYMWGQDNLHTERNLMGLSLGRGARTSCIENPIDWAIPSELGWGNLLRCFLGSWGRGHGVSSR